MTIKMIDEGDKVAVVEAPTYVVTPRQAEPSSKGIQKKHVLIMVGLILLAGLILAGILVGMHIFAEAQKEIVKFSMNLKTNSDGQNVKQDVEADPNDNVVRYHITKDGKDVDIVNDFNRDIQVVKMVRGSGMNCYVSALNRSASLNPSHVNGEDRDVNGNNTADSTVFTVSNNPISDRSFLPKKAQDMCKGVSAYWAYRSCNYDSNDKPAAHDRQRRAWMCRTGCGYTVCSCRVELYVYYYYGWRCRFYYGC